MLKAIQKHKKKNIKIMQLESTLASANIVIDRQKAEIKRLQERNVILRGAVDAQKAEIERLQKLLDDKCDRCITKERAEAIKTLAEDFEEEFFVGGVTYSITKEEFDEFIKSKVGEVQCLNG